MPITIYPRHLTAMAAIAVVALLGAWAVAGATGTSPAPRARSASTRAATDLGRSEVYTGIKPCRIFDTRQQGSPLADGARSFYASGDLTAQGGLANCGVPANATTIAINLTGISTGSTGFVRAYAAGSPQPTATLLNFGPAINVSNLVNIPLCTGTCTYAFTLRAWGSAHIVGDAVGYYTAPIYAQLGADGSLLDASASTVAASKTATGSFDITFDRDITDCSVQATASTANRIVAATGDFEHAYITVRDQDGAAVNAPFYVSVDC